MKTIAELLATRHQREVEVKEIVRPSLNLHIEWKFQSQVLLFEEQTCLTCGGKQFPFLGHFIEETKPDGSTKLTRGMANAISPLKKVIHSSTSPFCYLCVNVERNFHGD